MKDLTVTYCFNKLIILTHIKNIVTAYTWSFRDDAQRKEGRRCVENWIRKIKFGQARTGDRLWGQLCNCSWVLPNSQLVGPVCLHLLGDIDCFQGRRVFKWNKPRTYLGSEGQNGGGGDWSLSQVCLRGQKAGFLGFLVGLAASVELG